MANLSTTKSFACQPTLLFSLLISFQKAYVYGGTYIDAANMSRTVQQNETWSDLELFLPLQMSDFLEFKDAFARSYNFFWPKNHRKIVILLDAEKKKPGDKELLINSTKSSQTRISYNEPSKYYRRGWDRQQLVMFWADNFTDAEYVGFMDSDAMLITPVDVEDLFEDGKPVIIGGIYDESMEYGTFWKEVPMVISNFIGHTSFIRGMTYFPVIIKVEHLKELRRHVEQINDASFNSAFYAMSRTGSYSQFGVMCTFLWNHHRKEYSWHLQQTYAEESVWQLIPDSSPQARWAWSFGVTIPMLLPKPRVTVHTNYMSRRMPNETIYRYILFAGYCLDEMLRDNELMECEGFKPYKVQKHFFCFEEHAWTYHEQTANAFISRQERRRHKSHEWDPDLLNYVLGRETNDLPPNSDFFLCSTSN